MKLNETHNEHIKTEELLRDKLNKEQQKSLQFESDIKILNQELLTVRNEMYNQAQIFSVRLHEKENEISRLQELGFNGSTTDDNILLEDRIQSLTQALVQKQNSIETLTVERNALKLQLERTEDRVRQLITQNKKISILKLLMLMIQMMLKLNYHI